MPRYSSEKKAPIPAWLVSFGDMMTLILTFFILLVSMADTQDAGLLARGLGSLAVVLESHGMPGMLTGDDKKQIFNEVRARFNLPPLEDPEKEVRPQNPSVLEVLEAQSFEPLIVRREALHETLVAFAVGEAELDEAGREALSTLAQALQPSGEELLVIEGHGDRGDPDEERATRGFARARAVRAHLIEELGFPAAKVVARTPVEPRYAASGTTEARLYAPVKDR